MECDINTEHSADGQTEQSSILLTPLTTHRGDMDPEPVDKESLAGNNNTLPTQVSVDEMELLKKLEEANR